MSDLVISNEQTEEALYEGISSNAQISLTDLDKEQASAIERAQSAASNGIMSHIPRDTDKALVDRAILKEPVIDFDEAKQNFSALETQLNEEITKIDPNSSEAPMRNYLMHLQEVVGKFLALLGEISQKSSSEIEKIKVEYQKATKDSAGLQIDLGSQGLKFALGSLGVSVLSLFSPHDSDRNIAKVFAETVLPGIRGMFDSGLQAPMQEANNKASIKLQDYSAKTSQKQENSSKSQDVLEALKSAYELLRTAARAG
jgi:hypothetical protein